ncbi:MAG: glycogen debranching enzyme N-terminal domain-containing protein, partial [Phycisphaerales bacterium]|nr:glycogen debranching enzyme N-terminal domain-containing protein [Phycisphaerales bacterium]
MTSLPSYVVENTGDPEALAATEWLLTSGDGGFAMGTVLGPMSRRYHGVLVAPLRPPVQRLMMLSALAESAIIDPDSPNEQRFDLSCFRFRPGELHPRGDQLLKRFEKDVSCRWYYRFGPVELCKELVLARAGVAGGGGKAGEQGGGGAKGGEGGQGGPGGPGGHAGTMTPSAAMVRYTATVLPGHRPPRLLRLVIRPLVALRDFHGLILRDTARNRFHVEASARLLTIHSPEADLHLAADSGSVTPLEQWWYNFQYDTERERGYDFLEDLFHPGTFTADFSGCTASDGISPARLTIAAGLRPADPRDFDAVVAANRARLGELVTRTRGGEGAKVAASTATETNMVGGSLDRLVAAADDFVIRRLPPSTGMAGAAGAAAHPAGVAASGGGMHGAAGATGGTGAT